MFRFYEMMCTAYSLYTSMHWEVEYSPVLLRRFLRKSKVKPLCMLPQRGGVTHWEHGQYALSTNLETLNALKLKTVTLADSSKARYERSRSSVEIDYSHLTWIYVYIYTIIYIYILRYVHSIYVRIVADMLFTAAREGLYTARGAHVCTLDAGRKQNCTLVF